MEPALLIPSSADLVLVSHREQSHSTPAQPTPGKEFYKVSAQRAMQAGWCPSFHALGSYKRLLSPQSSSPPGSSCSAPQLPRFNNETMGVSMPYAVDGMDEQRGVEQRDEMKLPWSGPHTGRKARPISESGKRRSVARKQQQEREDKVPAICPT